MVDTSYKIKYKRTFRGLDVLQAVYAFILVLGLREVFLGSFAFYNTMISGGDFAFGANGIVLVFLFSNVILLGIRFFWVPRNLRRLMYVAATERSQSPRLLNLPHFVVAIHWVIIVGHATLFFLICTEFKYISFISLSTTNITVSVYQSYVILYVCFLALNAIWLYWLMEEERLLKKRARRAANGAASDADEPGSRLWIYNNLFSSFVAFAPVALVIACAGPVEACLSWQSLADLPPSYIPLRPEYVAAVFAGLQSFLTQDSLSHVSLLMLWFSLVMLANSLFDLAMTAKYYLLYEEVEWEKG